MKQIVKKIHSKELSPRELHQKLIETIGYSKKGFIIIGKLLYELQKNNRFFHAEGVESWIDYLAQPEIGLSKAEASRLMQIYEHFIVRFGFSEDYLAQVPIKNIHYLLPVIKKMGDDESVDELLEDARHLTQKDFRERVFDVKTNEEVERTYTYLVMKRCVETSNLTRVYGIESSVIEKLVDEIEL